MLVAHVVLAKLQQYCPKTFEASAIFKVFSECCRVLYRIPVITNLGFKLEMWPSHEYNHSVFQQDLQEAMEERLHDAACTAEAHRKSPYTNGGNYSRGLCV